MVIVEAVAVIQTVPLLEAGRVIEAVLELRLMKGLSVDTACDVVAFDAASVLEAVLAKIGVVRVRIAVVRWILIFARVLKMSGGACEDEG